MKRSDLRQSLVFAALIAAFAVLVASTSPSAPAPTARADRTATLADADGDDGSAGAPPIVYVALDPVADTPAIATECPDAIATTPPARRVGAPLALAPKTSPPALLS